MRSCSHATGAHSQLGHSHAGRFLHIARRVLMQSGGVGGGGSVASGGGGGGGGGAGGGGLWPTYLRLLERSPVGLGP